MNRIDISTEEKKQDVYELFKNFKNKSQIHEYYGISDNSQGCQYIKEVADEIGFDLDSYKKKETRYCLECGAELKKGQTKFCSNKCSVTHSNKGRKQTNETKIKISDGLKRYHNKHLKIKRCPCCGNEQCNSDVCKHTYKFFENLIYFGFNLDCYGTNEVFNEYNKIKNLLEEEYYINGLNSREIKEKYNYPKTFENITHILKHIGIRTRNTSECQINLILRNKIIPQDSFNNNFKHGWHITWDGRKIYYRSSFELKYAEVLDKQKTLYEVENLRILYYDTTLKRDRVAIPDFYLPETNEIVEIKSRVTFIKQNMIDKFSKYIELGYKPKLNYEGKEYKAFDIKKIDEYKLTLKN